MSLRFAKTFAVLDPASGPDAGVVQTGTRRRFTSAGRGFVLINSRAAVPKFVRPTPRKPRPSLDRPRVLKLPPQILINPFRPGFVPPSKGGGRAAAPAGAQPTPAPTPKAACPTCAAPVAVVRPDRVFGGPAPVLKFGDAAPAKRGAAPEKPKRGFPLVLALIVLGVLGVLARVNAVRTGSAQSSIPAFLAGKNVERCSTPTCRALKKLGVKCKRCGKG